MLPKESRLLDSKVGTQPTEPHTPSVQAIGDDSSCGSETEDARGPHRRNPILQLPQDPAADSINFPPIPSHHQLYIDAR